VESLTCALCRRPIAHGAHYVVRVDVFADPAVPPVSAAAVDAMDLEGEIDALLEQMKDMTSEELQDDVHRRFEYRVCSTCHKQVLANPMGMPRLRMIGKN
jgi:hypothetical protein